MSEEEKKDGGEAQQSEAEKLQAELTPERIQSIARESRAMADMAEAASKSEKPKPKRYAFGLREFFEGLVKNNDVVRILVEGGAYGVVLPEYLTSGLVSLHYGTTLGEMPKDLVVDDWGVKATLAFQHGEHMAAVPWDAVLQISDLSCFLWEDRRRLKQYREDQPKLPPKHTKKGAAMRRHLKAVH